MCIYSSLVNLLKDIFSSKTTQKQKNDLKRITIDNNPILHLVEKAIRQSKQIEYIN